MNSKIFGLNDKQKSIEFDLTDFYYKSNITQD